MLSTQDKLDLLNLLKKIQHIPEDFLKKFEEKLKNMSEKKFNTTKKNIVDAVEKMVEHQEAFMQTLNDIQRNEINPIFKNLEKTSRENEKQNTKNTLSQL